MDSDDQPPAQAAACCCPCSCPRCGAGSSPTSPLKRKLDAMQGVVSEFSDDGHGVARVEIEDEAAVLRETIATHQISIQELTLELEEERSAASSSATEAMSMILRLQREKAEAQMGARQFKLFAEEKMTQNQLEISELEDLIYKKDLEIQSLSCDVQAYRDRLLSLGIVLGEKFCLNEPVTPADDLAGFDYPQLRCRVRGDDGVDLEKYPFGETPQEQLQGLEQRIYDLERMPGSSRRSAVMDKGVVGFSPHSPRCSYGDEFPSVVDRGLEACWRDDESDRVYMVDTVHGAPENYVSTPREALRKKDGVGGVVNGDEDEIKKIYKRLQTLEADRESMRQTIVSIGTDKAQALLMKEIAQHLCKEGAPKKKIVKKSVSSKKLSLLSVLKCVVSFAFRRKPSPIKYNFGLSSNNAGLLILLDKSPRLRQRKFLTKSKGQ